MIKDLQLMRDITPLFEKNLVLWGIGKKGRIFLSDLKEMGVDEKNIFLCDSNCRLWGENVFGQSILSPSELHDLMQDMKLKDVAILVTVESAWMQNEILTVIEKMFGNSIDIYTNYAIEWGIYFNVKNLNVAKAFQKRLLEEHKRNQLTHSEVIPSKINALTYFSFCSLHHDEIILIYQPGKVASSTIYRSILHYNRYVLHTHSLTDIGGKNDLYDLLNIKTGKIISLVRDPIARQISSMWQNIVNVNRYSDEVNFEEIEKYYFYDGFENKEFEWFNRQLKSVFKIDIFDYPFNQDQGYSIIEEGKIQILLMKMERLNDLENVIGDFLGIEEFHLQTSNVGAQKPYRFALKQYKESFKIPLSRLQDIYEKNAYVQHFYSKQERKELYRKWEKHSGM